MQRRDPADETRPPRQALLAPVENCVPALLPAFLHGLHLGLDGSVCRQYRQFPLHLPRSAAAAVAFMSGLHADQHGGELPFPQVPFPTAALLHLFRHAAWVRAECFPES